jgi:hypothetical protein
MDFLIQYFDIQPIHHEGLSLSVLCFFLKTYSVLNPSLACHNDILSQMHSNSGLNMKPNNSNYSLPILMP